jgi:hypothetical protein
MAHALSSILARHIPPGRLLLKLPPQHQPAQRQPALQHYLPAGHGRQQLLQRQMYTAVYSGVDAMAEFGKLVL